MTLEIEYWLSLRPPDRIILVLQAGTLKWDRDRGTFDTKASSALPPAIISAFANEPPLWVDLREFQPSSSGYATMLADSRQSIAQVAAPLYGLDNKPALLVTADRKQQLRARSVRRRVQAALCLLTAASLIFAWNYRLERNEARRQELRATSSSLASQSFEESGVRADRGSLLALASWHLDESEEALDSMLNVLTTRREVDRYLHGHTAPVRASGVLPSGAAVTASLDGTIRLWSADGQLLHTADGLSGVRSIIMLEDGHMFSGHQDGSVIEWTHQPDGFEPHAHFTAHSGQVGGIAPLGDDRLVTVGEDGFTRIWDRASRELIDERTGAGASTDRPLWAVAADPNGQWIVAGGDRGLLFHWALGENIISNLGAGSLDSTTLSLAVNPDGSTLLAGGDDGVLRLFAEGETSFDLTHEISNHEGSIRSLAWSADGSTVMSGSSDQTARVWEVTGHNSSTRLVEKRALQHDAAVRAVSLNAAGTIAVSGSDDSVSIRWQFRPLRSLEEPILDPQSQIRAIAYDPTTDQLAYGGNDGHVLVHRLADEPLVLMLNPSQTPDWPVVIVDLAFDQQGTKLAAAAGRNVVVWDLAGGAEPTSFHTPDGIVQAVDLSPDGRFVAMASARGTSATVWDLNNNSVHRLVSEEAWDLQFGPEGHVLAVGATANLIHFWDVGDWETPSRTIEIGSTDAAVIAIAFDPSGRSLIASTSAPEMLVLDVDSGVQNGATFTGHRTATTTIAVGPLGRLMATTGFEGDIILWDLASREPLGSRLDAHQGPAEGAAFVTTDTLVSVGRWGERGEIYQWNLSPERLQAMACALANRNLDSDEWHRFVGDRPYVSLCPDLQPG